MDPNKLYGKNKGQWVEITPEQGELLKSKGKQVLTGKEIEEQNTAQLTQKSLQKALKPVTAPSELPKYEDLLPTEIENPMYGHGEHDNYADLKQVPNQQQAALGKLGSDWWQGIDGQADDILKKTSKKNPYVGLPREQKAALAAKNMRKEIAEAKERAYEKSGAHTLEQIATFPTITPGLVKYAVDPFRTHQDEAHSPLNAAAKWGTMVTLPLDVLGPGMLLNRIAAKKGGIDAVMRSIPTKLESLAAKVPFLGRNANFRYKVGAAADKAVLGEVKNDISFHAPEHIARTYDQAKKMYDMYSAKNLRLMKQGPRANTPGKFDSEILDFNKEINETTKGMREQAKIMNDIKDAHPEWFHEGGLALPAVFAEGAAGTALTKGGSHALLNVADYLTGETGSFLKAVADNTRNEADKRKRKK